MQKFLHGSLNIIKDSDTYQNLNYGILSLFTTQIAQNWIENCSFAKIQKGFLRRIIFSSEVCLLNVLAEMIGGYDVENIWFRFCVKKRNHLVRLS